MKRHESPARQLLLLKYRHSVRDIFKGGKGEREREGGEEEQRRKI